MANDSPADGFEEDTRRLLQDRLKLTFSVLAGVSAFYTVSEVVPSRVPGVGRLSPTLVRRCCARRASSRGSTQAQ